MNEDVCILIPTYNEEKTIGSLITAIRSLGHDNIFVVNDGTDSTAKIAAALGAVVIVGRRQGLGAALRLGMAQVSVKYRYVVVIDAGGTHDPANIASLVNMAKNGFDMVIASRFSTPHPHWGWRTKLSVFAAACVRKVLGIPVSDATSGFRCYDMNKFTKPVANSEAWGHAIQIELLALGKLHGARVCELSTEYAPLTNTSLRLKSLFDAAIVMWRMFVFLKIA